jgi:hypothetical protein
MKYCPSKSRMALLLKNLWDLFKDVQMQGAQKTEPQGVLHIYVERCVLQQSRFYRDK